jgi:hypothetical protein
MISTTTSPEALAVFAMAGYGGFGRLIALPLRTPPRIGVKELVGAGRLTPSLQRWELEDAMALSNTGGAVEGSTVSETVGRSVFSGHKARRPLKRAYEAVPIANVRSAMKRRMVILRMAVSPFGNLKH